MAESTRAYILYVLQTLKRSTDREHPLSVSEISERVNTVYGGSNALGKKLDRSTVARILLDLESLGHEFPVFAVMNAGEKEMPVYKPYLNESSDKGDKKYYYYDQLLTKGQILTIRDSMEAYNYLTVEDITDIIGKIIDMAPDSYLVDKYSARKDDEAIKEPGKESRVLRTIGLLHTLIKKDGIAKITYCNYGIDGKLHVRSGYPKLFKPINLLWGNGYYYCLCKKDDLDTPVSLRIDRITDIISVDKTRLDSDTIKRLQIKKEFLPSKSQYRMQHPVMFGGRVIHCEMLVRTGDRNGMINAFVDTFGRDIKMWDAAERDLMLLPKEKRILPEGEKWIVVRVQGTFGGLVLFAMQYGGNIRVTGPQGVINEIEKRHKEALELY